MELVGKPKVGQKIAAKVTFQNRTAVASPVLPGELSTSPAFVAFPQPKIELPVIAAGEEATVEHRADGRPVVISSRDIEDEDPYIVSVSLDRAIDRRWVDSSQALALPAGAAEAWLIVTADRWVDPLLADDKSG